MFSRAWQGAACFPALGKGPRVFPRLTLVACFLALKPMGNPRGNLENHVDEVAAHAGCYPAFDTCWTFSRPWYPLHDDFPRLCTGYSFFASSSYALFALVP